MQSGCVKCNAAKLCIAPHCNLSLLIFAVAFNSIEHFSAELNILVDSFFAGGSVGVYLLPVFGGKFIMQYNK